MIDTVIFDLDGTLLYTLEDLFISTNFALKKYGFEQKTLQEIRSFVGNGVEKLIERSLRSDVSKVTAQACLEEFKKHYSSAMYEKTRPYDEVLDLLGILNTSGINCAVVSNKYDTAVKDLCRRYFGKKIVFAVGERKEVRKKPCPDSVLEVIKTLGSSSCIYVGDSEVDIQTAKNAGIPCISVSWGYKDKDFLLKHGAEKIADNVEELKNYLFKA